ncbi:DUF3376 domain-containing protein [Streptomyces sp. NBC_00162]|uniref:DUF3376 domain-containing protein n=1 Tax=Streptomyces sp. NBC_00162 TaxID=2903629 RepID=UPI002AFE16B0|nr:DUF3376 domain-containing protein [Streptomyces sp. NBC_00162]
MNATGRGAKSSELRLALAMRGGVSLAVWMGGACCETAALRRAAPRPSGAEPEPGQTVYRALLDACDYDDVDIDVVVGTSAGGLNGVLLACHLVYGMPFGEGVRDVWLRLGDLEGLLRRSTPFHVPDSLMRGDEVFYAELRRSLDHLLAEPQETPPRLARSLRLILTATRLRPRRDWVRPTRGAPVLVGRSNAYFRFRHRAPMTDFPRGTYAKWEALNRLAFAARTSSSFPGAFEPGRMYVGGELPLLDEPPRVDMRGVSSETGYPDEKLSGCVELVDGGLLDNIPVAWAVRAIAGTPVTQKVDRWLLFLQPVPPFPPKPVKGGSRRVTRLVRMAVKSLTVKTGSESLRDDALELRATEAAAQNSRGVTGVLPQSLEALVAAATGRTAAYRCTVGAAEAQRLIRLLEDPADVTGPDPLPLPGGPGPLEPLDKGSGERSASLFRQLRAAEGEIGLPFPARSPLALARTARLLMDWVRAYEATAETVDAEVIEDCRNRLYTYRFAIATLIAARDRLLLRAYGDVLADGEIPSDPIGPLDLANRRLIALMPAVPPAWEGQGPWQAWSGALAAAVDGEPWTGPAAAGPVPWPDGRYSELWDRLGELGQFVGEAMAPQIVDGYKALHEATLGDAPRMKGALMAAEVLLGPLRPDPLAEATDISFHTVSAANTSWATRTVLPDVVPPTTEGMVKAKLSGNQLNNFAAFLSARWRLSDWTWGRLDAAASLVSVVATDKRLAAAFGGDGPDAPTEAALGALIAGSFPEPERFMELYEEALASEDEMSRWDRVRDTITALRQREILDQELPLIAALHAKGIRGGNRPVILEAPPLTTAENERAMKAFRAIGAEKVGALARARDPRRAALRTGLLAWPALQPATGFGARVVQAVLGLAKPLICLVPLVAVLAPLPALGAAALMWTGVAFSTGQWSSLPGHVPVAVLAVIGLAAWVWPRLRNPWERWPVIVGLAAVPGLALALLRGDPEDSVHGWPITLIVGAVFGLAAAALLSVGTDKAHWWRGVLAALFAGGVAALVQFGRDGLGGWWAALIVYAVLFVVTAVHPWLYPKPKP